MSRESRKERTDRWAREDAQWKASGLAGHTMVEVGSIRRGLRGQYAHQLHEPLGTPDWFYRESEDEQPAFLRVFVLQPAAQPEPKETPS